MPNEDFPPKQPVERPTAEQLLKEEIKRLRNMNPTPDSPEGKRLIQLQQHLLSQREER